MITKEILNSKEFKENLLKAIDKGLIENDINWNGEEEIITDSFHKEIALYYVLEYLKKFTI